MHPYLAHCRYTVSSSMIQCTTQPYPFAEEGRNSGWMRVTVTINGTQYDSRKNFLYRWWYYTPKVSVLLSAEPQTYIHVYVLAHNVGVVTILHSTQC